MQRYSIRHSLVLPNKERSSSASRSARKRCASTGTHTDPETRNTDGDEKQDIAAILRGALMDLAAALQEIEQQLTSVPQDGVISNRC